MSASPDRRRQQWEWWKRRLSGKDWLEFEARFLRLREMAESGEWEMRRQRFLAMLDSDEAEEWLEGHRLGGKFPGDSSRN